jgi:hypothetical protein
MSRLFVSASSQYLGPRAITIAPPFTISVWINPGNATLLQSVVALTSSGNVTPWLRLAHSLGTAPNGAETQHYDGTNNGYSLSNVPVALNTWGHLAGVFASNADRRPYVNGTRYADDTTTVGGLSAPSVYVGVVTGVAFWDGLIAELAVYNIVLSDAEIAQLAGGASPLGVHPAALAAYWPLKGDVSPEPDSMGGAALTVVGPTKGASHPTIAAPPTTVAGRMFAVF